MLSKISKLTIGAVTFLVLVTQPALGQVWNDIGDPSEVTTGIALVVAVPYLVISWATFKFPSIAALLGWILTTGFLVLTFLTEMSLRVFWLAIVLQTVLVGTAVMLDK